MKRTVLSAVPLFLILLWRPEPCVGQGLLPSPINIAQGKHIEATATCGMDVSEGRELFCKLATVPGKLGIHGLACDYCEPSYPSRNHSIQYAIDGTEKWWQSPPLSRGMKYQEVNITIDLGQVRWNLAVLIVLSVLCKRITKDWFYKELCFALPLLPSSGIETNLVNKCRLLWPSFLPEHVKIIKYEVNCEQFT